VRGASDRATDVVVALVLATGVACCTGLTLALLGAFRLLPVLLAGAAGLLAGSHAARGAAAGDGSAVRTFDGALVFLLALALYVPPYDATLYGADPTVYLATGTYVARHGTLRIDAPLLRTLSPSTIDALFPPFRPEMPAIRERCAGGLAFDADSAAATVYSTFAKLPSVWLGIGAALGGVPGALLVSPLLGAAGVAAYYLFLRRTVGLLPAILAAALLASSLPQLVFARISAAEIGGQWFLWGGLLALSRWTERERPATALAAGFGLGCAVLARIELLVFLPLAAVLAWLFGVRLRVPRSTAIVAAALAVEAGVLLVVLPTHYRGVIVVAAARAVTAVVRLGRGHPWAMVLPVAGALAVATWGAAWLRTRTPTETLRPAVFAVVVLWTVLLVAAGKVAPFVGAQLLPWYASWLALVLAVAGIRPLARALWRDDAGRLAALVGAVAAAHFLYDPHVQALPLWAGRRFVPVVLPILFASAATALAALIARHRRVGVLVALAALGLAGMRARDVWLRPFLRDTSAAVAGIAAAIPDDDAVVLLDPTFTSTLLDVSLWLVYGRESVQLRGAPGTLPPAARPLELLAQVGGRSVYLVRHALSPPPEVPGLRFAPVAERTFRVVDASDPRPRMLAVRIYRVSAA